MVKINKNQGVSFQSMINCHMVFVNYRTWLFCIRLINSIQPKVHWVQGLGLHFDWLNRLCLVDESVVGFRQLQVRGGMILSLKDNVKRCCIAVKEVSFRADALLFRARLISLKILILLLVIFTSFNLLISCQNISDSLVVKNAQHSAPWIYHDNQENGWIPIKLLWFASFFDPLYEQPPFVRTHRQFLDVNEFEMVVVKMIAISAATWVAHFST